MRDSEDSRRYMKLYGIDNNAYDFVDLKVDTTKYNPDEIVSLILQKALEKGLVQKNKAS